MKGKEKGKYGKVTEKGTARIGYGSFSTNDCSLNRVVLLVQHGCISVLCLTAGGSHVLFLSQNMNGLLFAIRM